MASWRIELVGPLRILKDGEPQKFRTRHQPLLLARLAAFSPEPISRAGTALLLWPEAPREQALTYLRRAVMEIRQAGLELYTDRRHIALREDTVECDLHEPRIGPSDPVMEGIDHPIADEIRSVYRDLAGEFETEAASDAPVPAGPDSMLLWLGNTLVAEQPQAAMEIFSRHGRALLINHPPGLILDCLLRVLSACEVADVHRVHVLQHASIAATLLTRYGLADRLNKEAIEATEEMGNHALHASILARNAFNKMEQREWHEARRLTIRAVDAMAKSTVETPWPDFYNNIAGIQWHMMQVEESVENYRRCVQASPPGFGRISAQANSTYVWAVFDVKVPDECLLADYLDYELGYSEALQAYGNLALGLGRNEIGKASDAAIRLLRAAVQQNMDRIFCIGIDCAALVLARKRLLAEAAAVVRVGARARQLIGHQRSPGEKHVVRRNIPRPYFGPAIAAIEKRTMGDDFTQIGERVQRLLRAG